MGPSTLFLSLRDDTLSQFWVPVLSRPKVGATEGDPLFVHVVLLKFSPETSEGHLEEIIDSLRGLPAVIPSLASYRVGRDLGLAADNFHIAVVAEFADEAGYMAYRDDPTHRSVITSQIQPHLVARSASQFRT